MLRRTGFTRKAYTPPPPAPLRPLQRPVVLARLTDQAQALPKTVAKRNRALLDMARGRQCLVRAPGVGLHPVDTTVACHSNLAEHGKAGARKADDHYSVWGCFACHTWLDQGAADAVVKAAVFDQALALQIEAWRQVASNPAEPERLRRAARWALSQHGTPA